jgi:hypothetical protein
VKTVRKTPTARITIGPAATSDHGGDEPVSPPEKHILGGVSGAKQPLLKGEVEERIGIIGNKELERHFGMHFFQQKKTAASAICRGPHEWSHIVTNTLHATYTDHFVISIPYLKFETVDHLLLDHLARKNERYPRTTYRSGGLDPATAIDHYNSDHERPTPDFGSAPMALGQNILSVGGPLSYAVQRRFSCVQMVPFPIYIEPPLRCC